MDATSAGPALKLFASMAGFHGINSTGCYFGPTGLRFWALMLVCWAWTNFAPNSFEVAYNAKPRRAYALLAGATMAVCLLQFATPMDFLYFRF